MKYVGLLELDRIRESSLRGYAPFGLWRETEKKISFDFFFKKWDEKQERQEREKWHQALDLSQNLT